MNDLFRLIDRHLLRPRGYRLVPSAAYRLPPEPHLERVAAETAPEVPPGTEALTVYLRTCLREPRRSRPDAMTGAPREATILASLASLVASLNQAARTADLTELEVVVADDRSEPDACRRIEAVLGGLAVPWRLETPAETRAGPVMHAQFLGARGADRLLYFVEDDYLHRPEAVAAMVAFYRRVRARCGTHLMLHPQEQRSLYVRHYPSYLVSDGARHWRTTSDMSHTFFTHGAVVRDHWRFFESTKYIGHRRRRIAHRGAERRTTNRILARLPGFCPLPALAAHFQAEHLIPPFFDWRPLFETYRPD